MNQTLTMGMMSLNRPELCYVLIHWFYVRFMLRQRDVVFVHYAAVSCSVYCVFAMAKYTLSRGCKYPSTHYSDCQGAASNWSANRMLQERHADFNAVDAAKAGRPVLLTGEIFLRLGTLSMWPFMNWSAFLYPNWSNLLLFRVKSNIFWGVSWVLFSLYHDSMQQPLLSCANAAPQYCVHLPQLLVHICGRLSTMQDVMRVGCVCYCGHRRDDLPFPVWRDPIAQAAEGSGEFACGANLYRAT